MDDISRIRKQFDLSQRIAKILWPANTWSITIVRDCEKEAVIKFTKFETYILWDYSNGEMLVDPNISVKQLKSLKISPVERYKLRVEKGI